EKGEIPSMGLHFYLTKIDPATESFEVQIAEGKTNTKPLPIEVAQKSFRTDYIVLETIVFPGINLFWLGSTLMMVGLGIAMFRRRKEKSVGSSTVGSLSTEVGGQSESASI
nr:cytochrome c biogenesis protein ResB [Saprospiraceae bacterium]